MENSCSHHSSHCCFPWSRFWTVCGMLVLFAAAVIVVLRSNPEPLDDDAERALLRVKNLTELRQSDEKMLTTYAWIDQAQGIVRLPIERAMELEIKGLNDPQWKPHAAYPIAPIDLVPSQAGMPVGSAPAAQEQLSVVSSQLSESSK